MKTIAAEVRFAEGRDAAQLAQVHEASWRGAYSGIIPFKTLGKMVERRGPDWWRRAIDNRAAILVVEFGGEIAGYATLGRNRTKALSAEGEIYEIYLQPKFQGLGFGRRLFDEARALLRDRGMRGVVVWALADNDNAMRFYSSVGGADVAEGAERFETVTLHKVAFTWK
ncbi:N-acetyltransferase GCN5 [Aureimonas sp. SA4125]|uniref:GNAT family N-acetyltransferase n=1 Tax=Aureimonas sp. SA4125 TaxID=2826993 RepID=UPI001CC6FB8F|nr:GNAT family N-acetyltransferase [Aureimonas sp. SA4125]BDA86717.1 N-acetyltransferase GCN5 [Aureimonas sp. SA4125]